MGEKTALKNFSWYWQILHESSKKPIAIFVVVNIYYLLLSHMAVGEYRCNITFQNSSHCLKLLKCRTLFYPNLTSDTLQVRAGGFFVRFLAHKMFSCHFDKNLSMSCTAIRLRNWQLFSKRINHRLLEPNRNTSNVAKHHHLSLVTWFLFFPQKNSLQSCWRPQINLGLEKRTKRFRSTWTEFLWDISNLKGRVF